jgi:predicted amidohydrolase
MERVERLNITTVQTSLHWEDKEKNFQKFEKIIFSDINDTHLVILPEMFTTGFSMQPENLAEKEDGPTLQWMQEVAGRKRVVLTGSFIAEEDNKYFNRLYVVHPDGSYQFYDKRHLFRMGEENKHYSAGNKRLIFSIGKWRICPLICYDLRFPVWSRNTDSYDLLFYVANWPESRRQVWNQLLIARALENQVYVAGVNRTGEDGKNLTYAGDSCVIDPKGNIMSTTKPYEESVETVSLSYDELERFRKKFPVGLDADDFELKI